MTFDVVVIGGGMAGVAAALAAAERGAQVAVIRATPGATALCSGAWNGPLPPGIGRALDTAGLRHQPCAHSLPHPSGERRACTHAAAAHTSAHIDKQTLVCGIAGLGGFHAPALARLWAAGVDAQPSSMTLRIDGTPAAGWSPVALAASLERDPTTLARPLAGAVRETGAKRAVLPAVLGLQSSERVIAALSAAAGIAVSEALGVAPSVPGWRLAAALDRALRSAGVVVIAGRAAGRAEVRRLGRVRVARQPSEADTGLLELGAATFVLATGKFAGGGIAGDRRFRETTLGCPVWIDHLGQPFDTPHPLALSHVERLAVQPILRVGVHADEYGRPVAANGDVVYDDVVVAGSVRAGVSTTELGLGGAAEQGWRAGERAVEHAR
jgi:glycerol-3-phosphate dehydrogenase subunit B